MGKGRKKTPAEVKKLRNTATAEDLKPRYKAGVPRMPACLTPEEKAAWKLLVKEIGTVLTVADRAALETLATHFGGLRVASKTIKKHGRYAQNRHGEWKLAPWVRDQLNCLKGIHSLCAEFGMTPATRSRVVSLIDQGETKDPFAEGTTPPVLKIKHA